MGECNSSTMEGKRNIGSESLSLSDWNNIYYYEQFAVSDPGSIESTSETVEQQTAVVGVVKRNLVAKKITKCTTISSLLRRLLPSVHQPP